METNGTQTGLTQFKTGYIILLKTIIKSQKEIIKHKKVERQTHTTNNLVFEKRTQPTRHKKNHNKPNIKRCHITGPLTKTA